MSMNFLRLPILSAFLVASMTMASAAHEDDGQTTVDKPEINNLITRVLEGVDGVEVILSHVALPANADLPKHWHPGEEFAYVLRGSVTLFLGGQDDKVVSQGEAGVVPLKRIHSARAGSEGVTLLVFRVHEQGKPGRVLVEE
jgi:quercetin dioxygenase-like cupin family protein